MEQSFLRHAVLAAIAAGIVFAQAPTDNSQPRATAPPQGGQDVTNRHLERLAQIFDLTHPQKESARTIFKQAELSAQPVRQESQQNLDKLAGAAKAGMESDIRKLAEEQGRLLGQLLAIRTVAWAKFYQMLTPEQRGKGDQLNERFDQRGASGGPKTGP